jgi:hypothetical protein
MRSLTAFTEASATTKRNKRDTALSRGSLYAPAIQLLSIFPPVLADPLPASRSATSSICCRCSQSQDCFRTASRELAYSRSVLVPMRSHAVQATIAIRWSLSCRSGQSFRVTPISSNTRTALRRARRFVRSLVARDLSTGLRPG